MDSSDDDERNAQRPPTVFGSACWHMGLKRLYFTHDYRTGPQNTLSYGSIITEMLITEKQCEWKIPNLDNLVEVATAYGKLYVVTTHPGEHQLWEADLMTLKPKTKIYADISSGLSFSCSMTICGDEKHLLMVASNIPHPTAAPQPSKIQVMTDGTWISTLSSKALPASISSMRLSKDLLFVTKNERSAKIIGLMWNSDPLSVGEEIVWGPVAIYSEPYFTITPSGTLIICSGWKNVWLFYDITNPDKMAEPIRSEDIVKINFLLKPVPHVAISDTLIATQYGLKRV